MSQIGQTEPISTVVAYNRKRRTTDIFRRPRKKAKMVKVVSIPRPKFSSRGAQVAFPQKKRVTLTYVEHHSVTPSVTGAASGVVYRLNAPYDPNQSGAGHQAMGFDQWATFYQKYTVLSAKITVMAANIDGAIKAGYFGIVPYSGVLTSSTDVLALSEDGDAVHGFYAADGTASMLSKSVDIGKYFSISNPLEDDTLQAPVTSLPSRSLLAYVWLAAAQGTLTAGGLTTYTVRVTYDVVFTEPKELPLS